MKNFKILTILILAVSALTFVACSGGSTPGDVVQKSFKLMKAKDFKAVSELYVKDNGEKLSEDEAKKIEGLLGMGNTENEKKDGVKKITIDEEKIAEDGLSARVKYTIEYGNGNTNKENAKLKKVDGKWFMVFSMN
ncbi:DUF4878 domain-containing protein [Lutibacter sp. TH_r2]|uniref:DUF4878 domain-containing protein n=1 Tax=Lutibacter sp. TH_r2 TaxID=3082083 RepID=UPI0029558C4D|nr:DUF4878 domain-containing protein [Lutibacter sp. TH_r2]MDV7185688.1 DUF4878 domain-containing protein [Lutibacter sp. TH_r2]